MFLVALQWVTVQLPRTTMPFPLFRLDVQSIKVTKFAQLNPIPVFTVEMQLLRCVRSELENPVPLAVAVQSLICAPFPSTNPVALPFATQSRAKPSPILNPVAPVLSESRNFS